MMRVGMLTSGGDCQSLNATMRGVAKALYRMYDDVEIIGFEDFMLITVLCSSQSFQGF